MKKWLGLDVRLLSLDFLVFFWVNVARFALGSIFLSYFGVVRGWMDGWVVFLEY